MAGLLTSRVRDRGGAPRKAESPAAGVSRPQRQNCYFCDMEKENPIRFTDLERRAIKPYLDKYGIDITSLETATYLALMGMEAAARRFAQKPGPAPVSQIPGNHPAEI